MPETPREGDQPLPTAPNPSALDVQTHVMQDIRQMFGFEDYIGELLVANVSDRRSVGIERYGSALFAFNGRDVFRDSIEEALDLVMYLKQAVLEGNTLFIPLYTRSLELLHDLKTLIA